MSAARKESGLTQEELAEAVLVSDRSIRSYEGGDSLPKPEILERICRVLKKEAWWFFAESMDRPPAESTDTLAVIRAHLDRLEADLAERHEYAWTDEMVLDLVEESRQSGEPITKDDLETFKSLRRSDKWKPVPGASQAARDDKKKRGLGDETS